MFVCLLVQEVKHVLDGERQGAPSVRCAEDGLKQVVHELLERALSTNSNASLANALPLNLYIHYNIICPHMRTAGLQKDPEKLLFMKNVEVKEGGGRR